MRRWLWHVIFTSTGWPFRLFQTSRWHQNKGCILVHGSHTKTELLFWCQREVWINVMRHPVLSRYSAVIRWFRPLDTICSVEMAADASIFDKIFSAGVPHIFEKIIFYLDYETFKEWLPDGYSQYVISYVFGPLGLKDYGSALLCCKIWSPPFLGLRPHALHPGAIQGKEGIKFCHLVTLYDLCSVARFPSLCMICTSYGSGSRRRSPAAGRPGPAPRSRKTARSRVHLRDGRVQRGPKKLP